MSELIEMEASAGRHIRDVLQEAVAQADELGATVVFDFNGTRHEVQPGEGYEAAKARAEARGGVEILPQEEESRRLREDMERRAREREEAIRAAAVPTEQEMRDAEVPCPNTEDELTAYIRSLVDRPHDYGTCVYAMSMAATAAFNYVAGRLGVTGFQASCADMDILRRTRGLEWGRVLDYSNLLYPQYCDEEHFPSWRGLVERNREELAKRARALLAERSVVSSAVVDHWRWLASLAPEP